MIAALNSYCRASLLCLLALSTVAVLPACNAAAQAPTVYPTVNKHLYSASANPRLDIAAAIKQARATHKRILLDFGGDWCGDCQLLDIYYRQSPNAEIIAKHFIIVHIDIGQMDHNVDIAEKYHVPIRKGVPALAILDSEGKLLYSEREKEFEHTTPKEVTAFLNRWKS